MAARGRAGLFFASQVVRLDAQAAPATIRLAQVCAPAVAVGLLLEQERR